MKKLLSMLIIFISFSSSTLVAAVMTIPSTLSASNFETRNGTLSSDGSLLLGNNSTIANRFSFKAGSTYQFSITAYGTPASGIYPVMRVGIDGYTLKDIKIESGNAQVYKFNYKLKTGGDRNLQLSFINDASTSTENRNLFIKSITITLASTTSSSNSSSSSSSPSSTAKPGISDTFTVSGFGSKTSTSYFEDFEDKVVSGSAAGKINLSNSTGQSVSTARAFSGSKSLQNNYAANYFPKDYLDLSGKSSRFYFSCYLHWTGNPAGAKIWKMGRIGTGDVYGGYPKSGESWHYDPMPNTFAGEIRDQNNSETSTWVQNKAIPGSESVYDLNHWMFYEFEHYSGTANNSDSYTKVTVDGVVVLLWENRPYLSSISQLPTWFLTPINGQDGAPNITVNMDGVYADESRARVVFTNSPNYSSSSIFNIQPIESYSDTRVVTKRSTPSFSSGQIVYVHMWKADGTYYYAGPRQLN